MTFEKGQSGNPNGRPKGIVDKRTRLREIIDNHAEELVAKLIETAKAGDLNALRLCIERLIPRAKAEQGIYFDLPEGRIDKGENMLAITEGITQAVASGNMTLEEAEKFSNFIHDQSRAMEKAERKISDEKWEKTWKMP